MKKRFRALGLLAVGCALALAVPAAAFARPVISNLRVEAEGRALDPGISYVNDTAQLRTSRATACGGSGRVRTVRGPTPIGLIDYARQVNQDLNPYRVSDAFEQFGLFVCGINRAVGFSADQFWSFKVNHVVSSVGGSSFRLRNNDQVLWYFVDSKTNSNTGSELVVRAPARARPGDTFGIQVVAYSDSGVATPAAGAKVAGQTTDADGRATVTASRKGALVLRAARGSDIPSAPVGVCVSPQLNRCPAQRGTVVVATNRSEGLTGGQGGDVILARGGNDVIDVRGGDIDAVDCGAGFDTVLADRKDVVARNCERVIVSGARRPAPVSPRFTG